MFCVPPPVHCGGKMASLRQHCAILPAVILAAGFVHAQGVYRDPYGRFTMAVPAGWTQSASDSAIQLTRGEAYATLLALSGEGNANDILSEAVQKISSQWQDVRPVAARHVTLAARPALFQGLVGLNPRRVQSFARIYAAVANGQAYLLIESGPMSQYSNLAAEMDHIASGITLWTGGAPLVNTAAPQSTRPTGGSQFEAPDHSISFPVPAGWRARITDLGGTPVYVLERDAGNEKIFVGVGPATASSIQELAQQGVELVTRQLLPGLRPASMRELFPNERRPGRDRLVHGRGRRRYGLMVALYDAEGPSIWRFWAVD